MPGDLRNALHISLQAYTASTDAVRSLDNPPKPRCGRIHYTSDFHIDIPIYHLDPDADERTLAAAGGWEISDPKALYLWFRNKFDDLTRARIRRQIRYLKCWAALKWRVDDGRPSSVLLTVLAAEAFARLRDDQIGADDETLLALLREIANRVSRGRRVRNPANPGEDLNRLTDDQWAAFTKRLKDFIGIAASACAANDEIEAADYWSRAFAHFFPMPDIRTALATDGVAKSQALVPITLPDVFVRAVGKKNRTSSSLERTTSDLFRRNALSLSRSSILGSSLPGPPLTGWSAMKATKPNTLMISGIGLALDLQRPKALPTPERTIWIASCAKMDGSAASGASRFGSAA